MKINKHFVYVLSKFLLYDFEEIFMVSLNYIEIMSCFTRERMKLDNDWGLSIKKYELGKEYEHSLLVETVREVVRKNGKLEEY